jgi:hypothetical protein
MILEQWGVYCTIVHHHCFNQLYFRIKRSSLPIVCALWALPGCCPPPRAAAKALATRGLHHHRLSLDNKQQAITTALSEFTIPIRRRPAVRQLFNSILTDTDTQHVEARYIHPVSNILEQGFETNRKTTEFMGKTGCG